MDNLKIVGQKSRVEGPQRGWMWQTQNTETLDINTGHFPETAGHLSAPDSNMMPRLAVLALTAALFGGSAVLALDNGLGDSPPMGWNSWNLANCA